MTTTPTIWKSETTFGNSFLFTNPKIYAAPNDTFFLGWDSRNFEISDLFASHFAANGSLIAGDLLEPLTKDDLKSIYGLQFVQQPDNSFRVIYNELFNPALADEDILFDGKRLDSTPADEFLNDATNTTDGGSAIVFDKPGSDVNFQDLTFLQFVSAAGSGGSLIPVGAHFGETQHNAADAGIFNGNVAVAYENFNPVNSDRDVRMHVFAPGGADVAEVGGSGSPDHEVLVSGGGLNAGFPDVALTTQGVPNDGSIVVVWQDSNGIEFRRFTDERAIPLDLTNQVVSNSGLLPHVAPLKDGGFIVEWGQAFGTESDGSPDFDIELQRYDVNGHAVGSRVSIDNPGDQGPFGVSLSTLADGRVVVAFANETGNATDLTTLDYIIYDPREANLIGTAGADVIVGRLDASTINGLQGNDSLTGNGNGDHLIGAAGLDTLSGGAGDDTAQGGSQADILQGGAGNDVLQGAGARDLISGGQGDDKLMGGDGNDMINSGPGHDQSSGGAGNDSFVFNNINWGGDRISDFEDGHDRLVFSALIADSFGDFTVTGNGTHEVTLADDGRRLIIDSHHNITLTAADFFFAA